LPLGEETPLDEKRYRDEWGAALERNQFGLAFPVEAAIKAPEDMERYQPPSPDRDRDLFLLDMAQARFGNRLAHFFMIDGVFTRGWEIRGMENLLMDMIEHPELVHQIFRLVLDYNLEVIGFVAEAGADAIIIEDDFASNKSVIMSPTHFKEFIIPYNQQLLDRGHKLGLKVVHHSDGNLWPILDAMLDMGYDGLNPLQPQGGMDLKKVKDYCGDRICLLGNIDCGDLLCFGTTDEVEAAVIKAIEAAAPGGGYILCDSNSIHPGVKPENFIAMVKAAKKYGKYEDGITNHTNKNESHE
jgi:uroporphyrinogen decarboxylase